MSPLLSIVIPSANRTELLDAAIRSILAEPGFDGLCEICIADGSPGDATETLVRSKYGESGKVIYRRRGPEELSLDEGVNKAVCIANGEYAWIFGDDDLIVEGFLQQLLDYLQQARPDVLILNSRSFQDSEVVEESRVPLAGARIYGPMENDAFLSDLGGYLTYVGGIVIKKSLWAECWRREAAGTYFAHIDAVCRAKIGRSAHYLPQPGISMRLHFQTWTARHFEIWNVHYPAVIWGLASYADHAKRTVIPRAPLKSLNRILASRAYGRFDFLIWKNILRPSKHSNAFIKLAGLAILLLPREFFRLLYVLSIRSGLRKKTSSFSPNLALAQLER